LAEGRRLTDVLQTERAQRKVAEDTLSIAIELLQDVDSQRRELAEALVQSQEQERQRIASDIHDDSIQTMVTAGMRLQDLSDRLRDSGLKSDVDNIEAIVAGAISRLRNLVFELDPPDLASVGLGQALRSYMRPYFRERGLTFTVRGRFGTDIPADTRQALYRIVHEALINVRKHASATQVSVILSRDRRGDYRVAVRDNGRGFESAGEDSWERVGHFGVRSMSDRARLVGGAVVINSAPMQGTTVRVRLPDPRSEASRGSGRQRRTG
jgi:signal transduction histidine kinase